MDDNPPLNIVSVLENMANGNQEEIYQALFDLDVVAERKMAFFTQELNQCDLGPFLKLLPTLPWKSRTIALRLCGKIFHLIYPAALLSKYADAFIDAFSKNSNEEVTIFYLKQLKFCGSTVEGISYLIEDMKVATVPILVLVAKKLQSESLDVAKHATDVLQKFILDYVEKFHTLPKKFMDVVNVLLLEGSVIRYRVYDLFVNLLKVDERFIEYEQIRNILVILIKELVNDDILSQLNCLEMLSTIASSSMKGLEFISEHGTLEELRCLFGNAETDPLQQLLLPGVVKCFGRIATAMPRKILHHYPEFVSFIFENVTSNDIVLRILCFETVASICSSSDGLIILYENPERLNTVISILAKGISSPMDETLKSRMIDSFKVIFKKPDEIVSNESSDIRKEIYERITERPINLLMTCSQLPFSKIRYSALSAIHAITSYSWSEQDILKTPGFIEYLLDRKTEQEKEGKELKYNILKTIAESVTSKENLGENYYEKICKFVREGPFYSEQQTAIDYERQS